MPYNSLISRADAAAMVPEQVSNAMLGNLSNTSAALATFTRIPVARNQVRFPVLSALPTAYFVTPTDTGLKQTTEAAWSNAYLNIEELAAIVPIPEAVLDDAGYDVFGAIQPLLEQAIARALDAAVFFGTNAPASWPDDVVTAAVAASNTVTRGTNNAAAGGIAEDLNDLFATLESDGYNPNALIANTTLRAMLRGDRDTTGVRRLEVSPNDIYGVPVTYPMAGQWPSGTSEAEMIALQRENFVIGVRQDMTYKIITEGVITDNTGAIIYNLPQQDMVALRVVFRVGWQVSNPINYQQVTEGSRYPAAVLRTPAS